MNNKEKKLINSIRKSFEFLGFDMSIISDEMIKSGVVSTAKKLGNSEATLQELEQQLRRTRESLQKQLKKSGYPENYLRVIKH